MARPDKGRKRNWRFRLNEETILEVSAPEGATEKQIRRRGRVSLVFGTVVAAVVVAAAATAADDGSVDGDLGEAGNQNSVNIATTAGSAVSTTAGLVINRAGNQAHLAVGDVVVLEYNSATSSLPAGASVGDATFTIPGPWTTNGQHVAATSSIAFTAPALSTTYTVHWKVKSGPPCVTATGNSDCFNMSGAFTINLTVTTPSNADPIADAGDEVEGNEGSPIGLDGTGSSDPDGDALDYSWAIDSLLCSFDDDSSATPNVTCTDNGVFMATLDVTDPDGATDSDAAAVTVANVAPVITSASFGTGSPPHVSCGSNNSSLTLSFTDAGSSDTHEADVDWDGATTPIYDQNVDPFTSGSSIDHTYSGGSQTAKVRVTDDDGGVSNVASAAVFVDYNTSGILQPVNDTRNGQQPSMFKHKSTIPVKIKVTDCDGSVVSTLAPTVSFTKLSGNPPPDGSEEVASTVPPTDGTTMRWDSTAQQYIYNLATKQLGTDSSATYRITVMIQTGQTVSADIGIKP